MIARFIFGRFRFALGIVVAAALPVALAGELAGEEFRSPPEARSTPVTRQEVWQAVAAELRQRGLAEPQLPRVEDLDLPVALPALAGRHLRVSSACWDRGLRRAQFRLQCGEPGECLPFLAYVHNSRRDEEPADAGWQAVSCGPRPLWVHPAAEASLKPSPQPTVRPGDRAVAVLGAEGLRMTASVICLERGRKGEVIRVRTQDGHIFRARVSGPARLEALPQ